MVVPRGRALASAHKQAHTAARDPKSNRNWDEWTHQTEQQQQRQQRKNPIGKFVWGKLRSCHVIEIHRLKTRASHFVFCVQNSTAQHSTTLVHSLFIFPFFSHSLVHSCIVSISRYHTIRYDVFYIYWVERVCVRYVERYYREVYRIKYIDRLCI